MEEEYRAYFFDNGEYKHIYIGKILPVPFDETLSIEEGVELARKFNLNFEADVLDEEEQKEANKLNKLFFEID